MGKNQFSGPIRAEWCDDGSDDMILLETCYFLDSRGVLWVAPAGRRINGASIPRVLWSLVGHPYSGDGRRASVLHDCGYEDHYHSREETDRMYLEAMIADDVDPWEANRNYNAVRMFGESHWGDNG